MLEQEIASIIKFTLDKANNPFPYYYNVPQSFAVPAAYFPVPEISTRGESFRTYAMEYSWFIKFFHRNSQTAYAMVSSVLAALKGNKNRVPLIDTDGNSTGKNIRLKDPTVSSADDGAIQLQLSWDSIRPYDGVDAMKMQTFYIESWSKAEIYTEKTISTALEAAIEKYL